MDYKIAAKAIANRLLQVLPLVVNSNQSCAVCGQNPVVNHHLLQDIVNHVNLLLFDWSCSFLRPGESF